MSWLRRYLVVLPFLLAGVVPVSAIAQGSAVSSVLNQPVSTGTAPFRWLGFKLYDATLYTEGGARFAWSRPAALELDYVRRIPRQKLVNATMDELERLEGDRSDRAAIEAALLSCFNDVQPGDRFTATASSANRVDLWFNDAPACTLAFTDIRKRFLSIWLSDQSRSASMTRRLKGGQ